MKDAPHRRVRERPHARVVDAHVHPVAGQYVDGDAVHEFEGNVLHAHLKVNEALIEQMLSAQRAAALMGMRN